MGTTERKKYLELRNDITEYFASLGVPAPIGEEYLNRLIDRVQDEYLSEIRTLKSRVGSLETRLKDD